jgi:hypothetical protein
MTSIVDNVRTAVMFILNKDNNGYLTPSEFNTFARLAQIEIFEDIYNNLNNWKSKKNTYGNVRRSNSGIGDVAKHVMEDVEAFLTTANLSFSGGRFIKPADVYSLIDVVYNGISVEKISGHVITTLGSSSMVAPTVYYPGYVESGDGITVYPTTINSGVSAYYVRVPVDPNWTYYTDPFGSPVFDINNPQYRDFELPKEFEPELILRVLAKAGITLRESDVITVVNSEEAKNLQKEQ